MDVVTAMVMGTTTIATTTAPTTVRHRPIRRIRITTVAPVANREPAHYRVEQWHDPFSMIPYAIVRKHAALLTCGRLGLNGGSA